jgi:hypothetical protein
MLKILRFINRLIFRSVFTVICAAVGLLGAAITLNALGNFPVDLAANQIPRFIAGSIGLVFFALSIYLMISQSASEWGRDTPLFRWMQVALLGGGGIAFSSLFLWVGITSFTTRQQTAGPTANPGTVLGLEYWKFGALFFGGLGLIFLSATLVNITARARAILGRKPAQGQDPAGDQQDPPSREGR